MFRAEHITSTTIDSKSDVGTSMSRQIQKHTHYAAVATSQDAKVDLKPLIVAIIQIYSFSETINLFFFLFLSVFYELIIFSAS